ncbi:response regulator transcription factor [Thermosediminibacter litoriperuensis]|uniref:Stage 0 sporulation protein A homolog n=1 Tax=Thermosediminibacter litoriperuensis TaxID=291989 RepID=A0A5S5AZT2_9FIRM|nr:response regulator transcription factor [Thermosediminibacter litoriperuensis]TYP58819.1 two-component system OmpR family response regulator [Thermosediminibacter litoriperuensis]
MGGYRILVVDDEVKLLNLIKNYLEKEGFDVTIADSGGEALKLLETQKFDLAVLDIMMPEVTGFDILRNIREKIKIPVIFLTARAEEQDKLLGLELGGDDYITKPFSLRELAARIRAVLRRVKPAGAANTILEYGGIKLDLNEKTAFLNGRPLSLTPTEFRILAILMANPGTVVSRLRILEEVLGGYYEGYERTLDTHISNLRKKLGDNPSNPCYIKTVYGAGYKLGGLS